MKIHKHIKHKLNHCIKLYISIQISQICKTLPELQLQSTQSILPFSLWFCCLLGLVSYLWPCWAWWTWPCGVWLWGGHGQRGELVSWTKTTMGFFFLHEWLHITIFLMACVFCCLCVFMYLFIYTYTSVSICMFDILLIYLYNYFHRTYIYTVYVWYPLVLSDDIDLVQTLLGIFSNKIPCIAWVPWHGPMLDLTKLPPTVSKKRCETVQGFFSKPWVYDFKIRPSLWCDLEGPIIFVDVSILGPSQEISFEWQLLFSRKTEDLMKFE